MKFSGTWNFKIIKVCGIRRVLSPVPRLARETSRPARVRDGEKRGSKTAKHYLYTEIIKYVTGQDDCVKLTVRHLENCQPCRAKAEQAKRIGDEIREAFEELNSEKETEK